MNAGLNDMKRFPFLTATRSSGYLFLLTFALLLHSASAQDRLKSLPGYARFEKMSRETTNAYKSGALNVTWKDEGKAFEFQKDGKRYHYDIATLKATEAPPPPTNTPAAGNQSRSERPPRSSGPVRGRQH